MYRIGLAGAGGLATVHANNFASIPDCQVVAIYDPVRSKAAALAAQVGAEVAENPDRLLASDDIDVLVIATPTDVHADYCLRAANVGKPFFCEKPMARTLKQGEAVVEAVHNAGVVAMVGHVLRWFPQYENARRLIHAGAIGTVGMVRMSRINSCPRGEGGWFADYDRSGGVMLDMSIHDLDWLLWTFGPVDRVYARGLKDHFPVLDYGLMSIRFRAGAIAHIEGSWADMGNFRTSFDIAGSGGLLQHDSTANVTLNFQARAQAEGLPPVQVPMAPAYKSPYLIEDEHFLECLRTDSEPMVTIDDAFEAIRLGLACNESAETGRIVRMI